MDSTKAGSLTVDAYIASFPTEIQTVLEMLRATIRAAAPDAEEKISYQMPAFAEHGNLVYYAAWKEHIGFYATGSGMAAFKEELSAYACTKGAVKFPVDQPLPLDLIERIVRRRVADNLAAAEAKPRKGRK